MSLNYKEDLYSFQLHKISVDMFIYDRINPVINKV